MTWRLVTWRFPKVTSTRAELTCVFGHSIWVEDPNDAPPHCPTCLRWWTFEGEKR